MNKKERIDELEEKFHAEVCNISEKFNKEISELRAEIEQEEQEWKPQYLEGYWYVDLDEMKKYKRTWFDTDANNTRLKNKVIFKTEDEAEEYLEYLEAKEKAMNEFSKEEWEDTEIDKLYIYYNYQNKTFNISITWTTRNINLIHFRTKEAAQEFINKYEKFLRRELGV